MGEEKKKERNKNKWQKLLELILEQQTQLLL